jgi:dCTP diphosphatase
MNDITRLQKTLIDFRNARDWKQFHNPKDLSISLVLEAAELLEHFQWKSPDEIRAHIASHRGDIGEELADVFNWILLLAHDLDINLVEASEDKLAKNAKKYPVAKAKGNHKKYNEL